MGDEHRRAMNAPFPIEIAEVIFWFHVVVIAFAVFGLVAIPVGARIGWRFVRVFWWRAMHLGLLGIVALQAVLGRACFLTIWEGQLLRRAGEAASNEPLIHSGSAKLFTGLCPCGSSRSFTWRFALSTCCCGGLSLPDFRGLAGQRRSRVGGAIFLPQQHRQLTWATSSRASARPSSARAAAPRAWRRLPRTAAHRASRQ